MHKLSFIFSKKGALRFISHLDLMRLFTRAMRRADLPLKISQGFNPHPKLSIARALKLGLESEAEEASVTLTENIPAFDFQQRLQKELPCGIEIKSVKQ
jgi:radical SAM-linked protein